MSSVPSFILCEEQSIAGSLEERLRSLDVQRSVFLIYEALSGICCGWLCLCLLCQGSKICCGWLCLCLLCQGSQSCCGWLCLCLLCQGSQSCCGWLCLCLLCQGSQSCCGWLCLCLLLLSDLVMWILGHVACMCKQR